MTGFAKDAVARGTTGRVVPTFSDKQTPDKDSPKTPTDASKKNTTSTTGAAVTPYDGKLGEVLWGPSPHLLTKPPNIAWQGYGLGTESTSQQVDPFGSVYKKTVQGRLGAIYNGPTDIYGLKAFEVPGYHRWGVQFTYNPTSISYGAGVDSTVTVKGLADQTSSVPRGAGTVESSFELYFNRIFDMSQGSNYSPPLRSGPIFPGSSVIEDQRAMILKRGTEYDIEFLYRVMNGDPRPSSTVDHLTSDYGLLAYNPVTLSLGPLRWLGFITGLSVNHILFTPEMVPTFSVVTVSFRRSITMEGYDVNGDPLNKQGSTADTSQDRERTAGEENRNSTPETVITYAPAATSSGERLQSNFDMQISPIAMHLRAELMKAGVAAGRISSGKPRKGNADNHMTGNAFDITIADKIGVPATAAQKEYGWGIANWLQKYHQELKVIGIIWQNRIWTPARAKDGWREHRYPSQVTQGHFDHIHVSVANPQGFL